MEKWIQEDHVGMLLRDYLRRVMGVSYSAMKSAKWDNRILVNGQSTPVDYRLKKNDRVEFVPKEAIPQYQLKPYPLQLDILYQDKWLMVIDKPAPLASQSSLGHPDDSLENAVYSHFGCPKDFIYRPVNRLDKGTSGLMTIALDAHTQHRLQQMLHSPAFQRFYLAVTDGLPPADQGVIDLPIAKVDEASIRRIVAPAGKPSVTHYQVLSVHDHRALVRLALETGRTHQIRVHLSHLGCPVFGDFLYGQESEALPGRFALHSHALRLLHPHTGEWLELQSPLPVSLQQLLL